MFFISSIIAFYLLNLSSATEVCYDPYGCFSSDYPFNFAFVQLPETPAEMGTQFLYYTRETPVNPQWLNPLAIKSPSRVKFDPSKQTVIFTHGFIESGQQWYVQMFIDEMLKHADMNLIFCEWGPGAVFPYHQAAGNARLVGRQIARMIEVIRNDTGLNMSSLHLVGFSLGAQVVGFTGRVLREKGIIVPRISGLDPASPYFENEHTDVRLDPTDADFVDVIHTDTKTLMVNGFGTKMQSGHLDFYPNGGFHQLGCGKVDIGVVQYLACSHYRAIRYFMESINSKCPYHGYPCPSYNDFSDLKCASCPPEGCPVMGLHAKKPAKISKTKYYLWTRTEFPYCGFHYKFTFYTGKTYFADLNGKVTIELKGKNATEVIELPYHSYAGDSAESHIVVTKTDVGELMSIKISHDRIIDVWKLNGVVVKPMWQQNEYTACYNRWINNAKNEVNLSPNLSVTSCTG